MTIYLPIVSEFKSDGIDKAKKEFKNLEGFGAKANYAIKKAAVPAAAALGAVAVALGDAVKGAMEDAEAQSKLAYQLKLTTNATDDQISSVEEWISAQGTALGVADDELRPALAKLVTQTHDVTKAQDMLSLAMDVAAATGKPLASVTDAMAKAAGGQEKALAKLSPELKGLIKDGMGLEEAMGVLAFTFEGSAANAADTAAGRMKRLGLAMSETKESVGAMLLPVLEGLLPYLQKFADWAQKNPGVFLAIAGTISGVALAIMAVNAAMALNPFSAIAAGVVVLAAGLVVAYKKFEWFRNGVKTVINGVLAYFETLINGWIMVVNAIIRAWNLVPGHKDIATIGHIKLGRMGDSEPASGGPSIPKMATGGIVTSPTVALIGEAGPEAVVPLDRLGNMGGNVTIHVNGGDPQAVVDAIRRYYRQNGPLPVGVAY